VLLMFVQTTEGTDMKIITATSAFNSMGREECLRGIDIQSGKWAVFIRPSGRIDALNWRVAEDATWSQLLAVVEV
jgi:hypothetical protein